MVNIETDENRINALAYIKATLVSIVLTLLLILVFAFVLKFTYLSDKFVTPINLVIKAISLIVGTLVLTKNGSNGLVKGLILGVIFSIVSYLIFSLMLMKFSFSIGQLADVGFCALVGAVVGAISVNLKKG
ncbi:MAG: TIGR04086 family membrane protein [bacterium]|nr:TIGR04086 family membrane protein [bacterium]